jgi:hypothetical protein
VGVEDDLLFLAPAAVERRSRDPQGSDGIPYTNGFDSSWDGYVFVRLDSILANFFNPLGQGHLLL